MSLEKSRDFPIKLNYIGEYIFEFINEFDS